MSSSTISLSFDAPSEEPTYSLQKLLTYILTLTVWVCLHSTFFLAGSVKRLFRKGAFPPFKVIQGHRFWYELHVRMRRPVSPSWSYVSEILQVFLHMVPPLFHRNFGGVPVRADCPCWGRPVSQPEQKS